MKYIHLDGDNWKFRHTGASVFSTLDNMKLNGYSMEAAVRQYKLPEAAILEAQQFILDHPELRPGTFKKSTRY